MMQTHNSAVYVNKFSTFLFLFVFSAIIAMPAQASQPDYTDVIRNHKSDLKSSDDINAKLFQPAMSEKEFSTFDGSAKFKANLTCSSEAPIVKATAFPVGNLGSVGELNIRIEYDRDLDGTMDRNIMLYSVGGMCGNGLIKNCKPSGSWRECQYCQWVNEGGVIREQCDYGSGSQTAPIGPQGLKGCFCFNASCGAPVLSMLETILSFAANGVLNELRKENNTLVVTKSSFDGGNMQLSYMGAKISNCSDVGSDSTIADLTALQGKFEFPYGKALADAEADPSHPYNAIASTFGDDSSTYTRCVIEARIGMENRNVERTTALDFGIGVDADGGSKQCYWFRGGYCGTVFGETKYLNVCISRIVPAAMGDLCNQFLVNGGVFDKITGIESYRATSGVANYIGCYGSENDSADQLWEVVCKGTRLEDVFICRSPSMGIPGEMIENANPSLFQGCNEIMEPMNSCEQLEKRRRDGECQLHSEVVDGVYSYREGASTGLLPASTCKNVAGSKRSVTVCEPWWKKERIYRCKGEEPDFAKAKERSQHIGQNIGFSEENWGRQGDLTWDKDGRKVTMVFDPNLEFMPTTHTCIPACRVNEPSKVTDIFVPGQGKLAADGSYHMPDDGQLSYTVNRDTIIETVRECDQIGNKDSWKCPLEAGETLASDCTCYDQGAFGQVVSSLSAVNMASTNMICSTGDIVGICSEEDLGETADRVVCGNVTEGPDGQPVISDDNISDCSPKLWRSKRLADQDHVVLLSDDFKCKAGSSVNNTMDLGYVTPDPAWFDIPVNQAISHILDTLFWQKAFIPAPETGCACSGDSCSWTSVSSEADVSRSDMSMPTTAQRFGSVQLRIPQKGYWQGVDEKGTQFRCGTHSIPREFSVSLSLKGSSFITELSFVENGILKSWPFDLTSLVMRQCVDRYTKPYADFTDPLTKYPFRASHFDRMAFSLAADRGELPRDGTTGLLPVVPPTYRPLYEHEGGVEKSTILNVPMFWEASFAPEYISSLFTPVRLRATNLTAFVYYYQCPLSNPVASGTNNCGGVHPFGGVDQTISGPHCFRHRCDAQAKIEPAKSFSGCGMVNDAEWQ
ncbi:hypothetical protein LJC09_02290 [Desulfovibrio sp. OttesenSCG-928-F20]|nr:hypothetical protein [Desulfovibrio sp. OttesenSCG-928-F20]